LPEIYC